MENRIPVPTDNIYKFYALFSLLLFVFSVGASIYVTKSSNEVILGVAPEVIRLEQIAHPTPAEQQNKSLLSKKIEITVSDRKAFTWGLAVLSGLALAGMAYGFQQWHKVVQPRQDKLLDLQIQLAELQIQSERKRQSPSEA